MAKLSTYQKLKQENEKLKQDLITLATSPNSHEGICIKAEWVQISKLEEALWLGSNQMPAVLQGLLNQVRNSKEY